MKTLLAGLRRLRLGLVSLLGAVADGDTPGADGTQRRRLHAERDDDFVVFHIGMVIESWWKVHRWLPVFLVAPRMVRELRDEPDSGLLGSRTVVGPGLRNVGFVQYWDSFESLRAYARDSDGLHVSAWRDYASDREAGGVGIWHETYLVRSGEYETVYDAETPRGLGAADGTRLVEAADHRASAAGRLGRTDGSDAGPTPGATDSPTGD